MKYHLIGIGGISMSALAELLSSRGHEVTGSDLKTGGHKAANVDSTVDVVVRTSAVNPGSPGWVEVQEANRLNIPVMKRSELLGQITDEFELIAISGMHGKTTTTSLAGLAFIEAKLDPTVLVGEHVSEFGGSPLRLGKSKYFIFEACEYDRSFLDFRPKVLILTNIDEEHLDTYPGGLPEIKEAFAEYLKNVKSDGVIIANSDDNNIKEVIANHSGGQQIVWYGSASKDYAELKSELSIPGRHNRSNALAVSALADLYEIDGSILRSVFLKFKGAKRRMEYWGELNNSLLFDDYGHHPTEIAATVSALKEKYPDKKLIVIFWPHQYKRIKPLVNQFADAFMGCERVFIKEIFFVPGRDEKLDVSSAQLANLIRNSGIEAVDFFNNADIYDTIKDISKDNSIMLTIGIPPIYKLWEEILGE